MRNPQLKQATMNAKDNNKDLYETRGILRHETLPAFSPDGKPLDEEEDHMYIVSTEYPETRYPVTRSQTQKALRLKNQEVQVTIKDDEDMGAQVIEIKTPPAP